MSTKNLTGDDALKKLRDLTDDSSTCLFASGLTEIPSHVCPMQVQQVDQDGCLWFFSGADSVHNSQLAKDPRAQLNFCNSSKIEFLTIHGEVSISTDRGKIEELWTKLVEAWFPGGTSDPNVTLLCVRPIHAHYWDTEGGRLISFAKMLTAAVTGATQDVGVQGDLEV